VILRIDSAVLRAIRRATEASYPSEGCGFLVGKAGGNGEARVLGHEPVHNQRVDAGSGRNRYEIAPADYLEAEKRLRPQGLEILGTYHSHPDHPAKPSEYDREHAWPWFRYLIVSVAKGVAGDARVWQLADDRAAFVEHTLQIEES
jgi:proteasome lid subunit RPN8/RPN11